MVQLNAILKTHPSDRSDQPTYRNLSEHPFPGAASVLNPVFIRRLTGGIIKHAG